MFFSAKPRSIGEGAGQSEYASWRMITARGMMMIEYGMAMIEIPKFRRNFGEGEERTLCGIHPERKCRKPL